MKFETLIIRTREVLTREIEIRVSRPVDRPEPCGPDAIEVTPRPRRLAKKQAPLMLAAPKVAA